MKEIHWNEPKELIEWFREYVPAEGKCDTVGGEIVRACNKIIYRYLNDGDKIGCRYGKETCNASARYLVKAVPFKLDHFKEWVNTTENNLISNSKYEDITRTNIDNIVDYLKSNSQLFETKNEDDMLDFYDEDYDVEVDDYEDDYDYEDEDEE